MSTRGRGKRLGASTSTPVTEVTGPDQVWAFDFQFDSTVDGRRSKVANMIDEHTRESLLHLVSRSITGDDLVTVIDRATPAST